MGVEMQAMQNPVLSVLILVRILPERRSGLNSNESNHSLANQIAALITETRAVLQSLRGTETSSPIIHEL